jgi:hypothetical protein
MLLVGFKKHNLYIMGWGVLLYSRFLKTCHPLSFRILPFFRFAQYGISQLSTSKYRAVVQQSKSYKHPSKARLLGFPTRCNGDSERVEERSCGFRVEKARS